MALVKLKKYQSSIEIWYRENEECLVLLEQPSFFLRGDSKPQNTGNGRWHIYNHCFCRNRGDLFLPSSNFRGRTTHISNILLHCSDSSNAYSCRDMLVSSKLTFAFLVFVPLLILAFMIVGVHCHTIITFYFIIMMINLFLFWSDR